MQEGSRIYSIEALTGDPLATRNTILFAALTALGIEPDSINCGVFVEEVDGKKTSVQVWRLQERSFDGRYNTAEMIKLWDNPAADPEHPLIYIKSAFENHTRARDFLKARGPIAVRRRGRKIALITKDTTPAHRKLILDGLNRD